MRTILCSALAVVALGALPVVAAEPVSLESLLNEMVDRDTLAQVPVLAQDVFQSMIGIGDLDSNELSETEITWIRRREAERSAAVLGAVYHPPIADDLLILYEERLLRRMAAVVREVRPTIVLLPSLNDYMEDHTNTARLAVTACFSRAMRHFQSDPPRDATDQDVYLYHAQPHLNRDGMRELVVPSLLVNVTGQMETKLDMLGCHESQRQWLDETQGLGDYLEIMRTSGAEVARMADRPDWQYAEGFRQHSHVGFSAADRDLLADVLGGQLVCRR